MICDRFRSKRRFDAPIFNGQYLERINKLKYLGMYLSPDLKPADHMETKVKESAYKMNKLKRCGYTFSSRIILFTVSIIVNIYEIILPR